MAATKPKKRKPSKAEAVAALDRLCARIDATFRLDGHNRGWYWHETAILYRHLGQPAAKESEASPCR